jgi:hypothetical protein
MHRLLFNGAMDLILMLSTIHPLNIPTIQVDNVKIVHILKDKRKVKFNMEIIDGRKIRYNDRS